MRRAERIAALMIAGAVVAGAIAACAGQSDSDNSSGGAQPTASGAAAVDCSATPQSSGCSCSDEGQWVDCGEVHDHVGDYLYCTEGRMECSNGTWSACSAGETVKKLVFHPEGLDPTSTGCSNPCDPTCQVYADTPTGLDAGAGFVATDAGLTLSGSAGGSSCTSLSLAASGGVDTLTVTGINYTTGVVTTSPALLTYVATCSGSPLVPSWTISNVDLASISVGGVVTAYSGVAGDLTVTASSPPAPNATAAAHIRVAYDDPNGAPTSIVTAFAGGATATDSGSSLYPYHNTVFPLNAQAPVVMWNQGGNVGTYVKVQLRYPQTSVSATPTFEWSQIDTGETGRGPIDTTKPSVIIPQKVWNYFDRSSAGDTGEINIFRYYGGAVHGPITIPVKFATDSLRGTAYYTQYYKTVTNTSPTCTTSSCGAGNISSGSYTVGATCPVGNNTHYALSGASTVRSIDMTNPSAAPQDPFGGTAGCPVCHSVSADGTKFVAGSRTYYVRNGCSGPSCVADGVDKINSDGTFTAVSEPQDQAGDSRGFSYGALTPDGKYVLQGYNFWGNTNDSSTSTTTTTQSMASGHDYEVFDTTQTITVGSGSTAQTAPKPITTVTGLTGRVMMTPVFSPDGTKFAYVAGDSGGTHGGISGATGWRKGIMTMGWSESGLAFSNPLLVVNTWGGSNVPLRWPFWEPDNRTITFQESEVNEVCNSTSVSTAVGKACYNATYGSMSPTTRGYWKGDLYSVDTQNPGTVAALATLNAGETSADADKAYQPSMLPFTSGGYRWVMFTSPRPYGNQFNVSGTNFTCYASTLWIAAVDDTTGGTGDRSHPAFFLGNQAVNPITSAYHFVNERGYLVQSPCKAVGSACTTSSECCNSSGTSPSEACTIDLPVSTPPTRHCSAVTGTCATTGASCASTSDCCTGLVCSNNSTCQPQASFAPSTFTRDYSGTCPDGYSVTWHLVSWNATSTFPGGSDAAADDSKIVFAVQTSNDDVTFAPSTALTLATAAQPWNPTPASEDHADIDTLLRANSAGQGTYLRLSITMDPSSNNQYAPILQDWSATYDCTANQ